MQHTKDSENFAIQYGDNNSLFANANMISNQVEKEVSEAYKRHKKIAKAAIENMQQMCDDKQSFIEKRDITIQELTDEIYKIKKVNEEKIQQIYDDIAKKNEDINKEIKDHLELGAYKNDERILKSKMSAEGFSLNEFSSLIEIKDKDIENFKKTISKLENEIKERNNYANSLDEKLNEINNNIEEDKKNKSTVFLNDHIQKLKTKLTQKEKELKNLKNSIKHLKEELLLDAEKAEK